MKRDVIEFLRPTFVGLLLFAAVVAVVEFYTWRRPASGTEFRSPINRWADATQPTALTPTVEQSPAEVVNHQLAALSDVDRVRGILQCWAFASPANRAATGPPERFGKMLLEPPYDALAEADRKL